MVMEAYFADLGRRALHGGRPGLHRRRGGEFHRAGSGDRQSALAFPVRRVGQCGADDLRPRRETVCCHRRGFDNLHIRITLNAQGSKKLALENARTCDKFRERERGQPKHPMALKLPANGITTRWTESKRERQIHATIRRLCSLSTTSLCASGRGSCSKT